MSGKINLDIEAILQMHVNGIGVRRIAKAFGVSARTIENRIHEHTNRPNEQRRNKIGTNGTLCWNCQHAVGRNKCSWAAAFVPVKGWDAVHTVLFRAGESPYDSYHVYDCPQFQRDKPRKERVYDWFPDRDGESDAGARLHAEQDRLKGRNPADDV